MKGLRLVGVVAVLALGAGAASANSARAGLLSCADNPERVFSQPRDIVDEVLMTRGEKLATHTRWRQTVLEELSASGEGMRTIRRARWRLDVRTRKIFANSARRCAD